MKTDFCLKRPRGSELKGRFLDANTMDIQQVSLGSLRRNMDKSFNEKNMRLCQEDSP